MSSTATESWFDDAVRSGAPSAAFKKIGDFVLGEILEQYTIEATDFATKEILRDKKTNEVIKQLVVVLQTDKRNWDGVAKIPRVDANDPNSAEKPGSDDDGKRAIYVRKYTNIHSAIGKAVQAAVGKAGPILNGGRLGVEFYKDEDRGKGNPLKHYRAKYEPPKPDNGAGAFFDGASSSEGRPAQAPQAAPAPAPAAPPAAQDPWATSGQGAERTSEPPF